MTDNIIDSLCYPKPNTDDLYVIYQFEISLIDSILNGEVNSALKIYEEFFSNQSISTIMEFDNLRCMKNYIISLTLLTSHYVVKKGVSSYSARAKYNAFSKSIEDNMCRLGVLSLGKKIIVAYATQVIRSLNTINNISIQKAIDYIHNNLGEDLTLDIVAKHANLSRCYFCTQFKKETKMSFIDYLTFTRIEKSKYLLLNSNKSILDIAILMGFNSQSYFTTQFKKYNGITPNEFRRNQSNTNYRF